MSQFTNVEPFNEDAEEEHWDEPEDENVTTDSSTRKKKNAYYDDAAARIQALTGPKKARRGRVAGEAEADRRYGVATEMYVDGKLEEARTALMALIADFPTHSKSYRTLALIHQDLGEDAEAASNYEIAGDRSKDGHMFVEAAKLYRKLGDSTKALACFTRSSRLLPDDVYSLMSRAEILLEQNQAKKALPELTLAHERDPGNLLVLEMLARAYDASEDRVMELKILSEAYALLVRDSEMSTSSRMAAANAKGYSVVEHMSVIVGYAKALIRRREWQQVLALLEFADLRRGLRQLPVELSFYAAICKVHTGEISEARSQIHNRLLKQDLEEWGDLFMQLVDALYEKQEWDDALQLLIHLADAFSDKKTLWTRMADCYEQKGEFHNSAHYYELCFEVDKTDVAICLALSRMYDRMGLLDQGIQVVQQYERLSGLRIDDARVAPRDTLPRSVPDKVAGDDDLKAKFADIDAKTMITVQKAKLFFSKREYQSFIDILTPVLSDPSMWFNRNRRHTKAATAETVQFEDASIRKRSKRRGAQTPLDPLSGGIATIPLPSTTTRSPTSNRNTPSASYMEEGDEEEFMAADDEVVMELAIDDRLDNGLPADFTSKKRKRMEFAPAPVARRADPLDEAELVTYEVGRDRWAIPTQDRLAEMKVRKNVWEICGMAEFLELLTNYCKCVLFLSQATKETLHIVDTLLKLVTSEQASMDCDIMLMGDLWFHVAQVAYAVENFDRAARLMRTTCQTFPYNIHLWNFFFKAANRTRDFFLTRVWVLRQLEKKPDCVPLHLLYGHISLMSRSYTFATVAYLKAFSNAESFDTSSSSLMLLCTAVTFLCRAMSRGTGNRNAAVVKAFAFFYKYFIEQYYGGGNKHEAFYNMARAYHHISLYQYAIPLYEKVLMDTSHLLHSHSSHQPYHGDGIESPQTASLQREAAYNLAMIYRQSGSQHLARKIMMEYLTF